jgi:hypothetical protein
VATAIHPATPDEGESAETRTAELRGPGVLVADTVHHESLTVEIIGITSLGKPQP